LSRAKKKLDPRRWDAPELATKVDAMVDFPTPGSPLTQRIFGASRSPIHLLAFVRISRRVSFIHSAGMLHPFGFKPVISASSLGETKEYDEKN
jgi:hypothetical protein